MKRYTWSDVKNAQLKRSRGVSFEEMVEAIADGGLVDVLEHPNRGRYPAQRLFIVRWRGYVYVVPFVETRGSIFFKTIIPSRKMQKRYGGRP